MTGPAWQAADTYAAAANGPASQDLSGAIPMRYALCVVALAGGTPSVWDVILQGSLDGVNWTTLLEHKNGTVALGVTTFSGANFNPVRFLRTICTGTLTLNGSAGIVAQALAV